MNIAYKMQYQSLSDRAGLIARSPRSSARRRPNRRTCSMFGLPTFEGRLGRLLSVAVVGLTVGGAARGCRRRPQGGPLQRGRAQSRLHQPLCRHARRHLREERPEDERHRRRRRHPDFRRRARRLGGLRDRRRHHGADVARGRRARRRGRHRRPARALLRRVEEPRADHRPEAVQGPDDRHLARAQHQLQRRQADAGERRPEDRRTTSRSCRSIPAPRSAPCWPARPTWRSPTSRASPRRWTQGAKVVFDFSNYVGPFCNTGIMVLPSTIAAGSRDGPGAGDLVRGGSRLTYSDPGVRQEGGAARSFPTCPARSSTRRSTPSSST